MSARSYTFTHAVVRAVSRSIVRGLRAVGTCEPNFDRFNQHHDAYVATLASTGAIVIELVPLEEFPDSVFIEDTALCLPEGAIVMRPGAPSRLGEEAAVSPTLPQFYQEVISVEGPGFIEGGVLDKH